MPRPNSEYLDALRKAQSIKREIDIAADALIKLQLRRNVSERVDAAVWEVFSLAREGRSDLNSHRQCEVIRRAITDFAAPSLLQVEQLTVEMEQWRRRAEKAEADLKSVGRKHREARSEVKRLVAEGERWRLRAEAAEEENRSLKQQIEQPQVGVVSMSSHTAATSLANEVAENVCKTIRKPLSESVLSTICSVLADAPIDAGKAISGGLSSTAIAS